jgi:AAA15 family ATPase/GTPase
VQFLKEFEPDITDLRYIDNEMQRAIPIVETKHKYIPLSVYGDGMKRALMIFNSIVSAQSGVVLIDEFETAIHTSVMRKVFAFIIESAKKMDVQLFLTTHSLESLDKLLESAGNNLDSIRLIRLKKKGEKTYAKVMSGDEAKGNRDRFEMELRV